MGRLKMKTGQGLCRPAKMTLLGVLTQSSDNRRQLTVPVVMDADNASSVTNFPLHLSISPPTSLTPNVLLTALHLRCLTLLTLLGVVVRVPKKNQSCVNEICILTQGSLRPGDDNLVELGCRADIS